MPLEIERKYLVIETGLLPPSHRVRLIESSYLSTGDPEVRISRHRDRENSYKLTVKSGSGLVRSEVEFNVSDPDGDALMAMIGPRPQIEKTRYYLGRWEYDLYHGRYDGLTVLEIELASADEPVPDPPNGLEIVRDVTDAARFKNRCLATGDHSFVADILHEYRYHVERHLCLR